ncbi:MAG: lytic transglycosylase domain-containing protein [Alphaproteobacteria bacterium]
MSAKTVAACILLAAQTHDVPPALLIGIYRAEGGEAGLEVANTNGSHDLGLMQINTLWIPGLAEKWKVSEEKAHEMVRDDVCINVDVAASILRQHLSETRDLARALEYYHSRTPELRKKYKDRVLDIMRRYGLLKTKR